MNAMNAVYLSLFMSIVLLFICTEIAMRVRLSRTTSIGPRWWRQGYTEVLLAHRKAFPQSRIFMFRVFAFWLGIISSSIVLALTLTKSH